MAIIALTYIVDVTVEFQFNAMAKQAYTNQRELTAFLGSFYGLWLNLITFVLQFFLTAFVVSHFGVGGALQIMPVSIAAASIATYLSPGVISTGAARLTEAATRYSFNKTGMELLVSSAPARTEEPNQSVHRYLRRPFFPRHRRHPFDFSHWDTESLGASVVDCGFRLYHHLGLIFPSCEERIRSHGSQAIGVAPAGSRQPQSQRQRSRNNARSGRDDRTQQSEAGRLRVVAAVGGSAIQPGEAAARNWSDSTLPEVRGKVYELAKQRGLRNLYENALAELRSSRFGDDAPVVKPAVEYALWVSSDTPDLAKRLFNHPNQLVARSALSALAAHPEAAEPLITPEWISEAAASKDKDRRVMAAIAIAVRGDSDVKGAAQALAGSRSGSRCRGMPHGRDSPEPGLPRFAAATARQFPNARRGNGGARRLWRADRRNARRCAPRYDDTCGCAPPDSAGAAKDSGTALRGRSISGIRRAGPDGPDGRLEEPQLASGRSPRS